MTTDPTKIQKTSVNPVEPPSKSPFPGMTWIPGGTFRMGSEKFYPEEAPVQHVAVDGFWMDTHQIHRSLGRIPPVEYARRATALQAPPAPSGPLLGQRKASSVATEVVTLTPDQ